MFQSIRYNTKTILSTIVLITLCSLILLQQHLDLKDYQHIRASDTYMYMAISQQISEIGEMPKTYPSIFPRTGNHSLQKGLPLFFTQVYFITDIDYFTLYRTLFTSLLAILFLLVSLSFLKRITGTKFSTYGAPFATLVMIGALFNPSSYSVANTLSRALPQSLAAIFFFLELFLIYHYLKKPSMQRKWLILILITYLAWYQIHVSHMLFIPLLIIAITLKYKKVLFKLKNAHYIILLTAVPFLFFQKKITRILSTFESLGSAEKMQFNYFKVTVGTILLTLGIVGAVVLYCEIKKGKTSTDKNLAYPAYILVILLFLLTTLFILPQFGLFHVVYTRRFLIFVSFTTIPLTIVALKYISKRCTPRKFTILLSIVLVLSATWFQPKREGGWIAGSEADVIPFLRNETPKNSIFFTQLLNSTLFYQTGRTMFNAGNHFEQKVAPATLNNDEIFLASSSAEAYNAIINSFDPSHPIYSHGPPIDKPRSGDKDRPKYILFSTLKPTINSSWGAWWMDESYPNANIENFRDVKYFKEVFKNKDVIVWKVNEL